MTTNPPQNHSVAGDEIRRVGIIFSGGPAPGANAVISAAAVSFLDSGRQVVGFYQGYQFLQDYHPVTNRLERNVHYREFHLPDVTGIRTSRGILIGTSRANPGKPIRKPDDLDHPEKAQKLRNIYYALLDLKIDALISIGGDDTLKTANYFHEFQKRLPDKAKKVRIVHLPKTIDNDYKGIDFTFGYFTAVDFLAREVRNLREDARATCSYFIVETMGRKSGWLSYGVGIAGEANMIFSVEDLEESMMYDEKFTDAETGEEKVEKRLRLECFVDRIVNLMIAREKKLNKRFGVLVLAEGLAEKFPETYIRDVPKDPHGHIGIGKIDIGRLIAKLVAEEYARRTGMKKKVTGVQIGYEGRCSEPHAFDIMLGSQLGIGAYRALVEEGLDGHMVSASGQLDLHYVPFSDLVDPGTLLTDIRFIQPGSDFYRMARFLEPRAELVEDQEID
ncbi:MAG: 6-phosphofructokinase [bacterium]